MSEQFEIPRSMSAASVEGNVRIPQSHSAINTFLLGRILGNPRSSERFKELVAPMPLTGELEREAHKANAQHRARGIDRVVTPESLRRIKLVSNEYVMISLSRIFDIDLPQNMLHSSRGSDEKGEWASSQHRAFISQVQEAYDRLSLEDRTVLTSFLARAIAYLRSQEAKDVQATLAGEYENYGDKSGMEQSAIASRARTHIKSMGQRLVGVCDEFITQHATNSSQKALLERAKYAITRSIV